MEASLGTGANLRHSHLPQVLVGFADKLRLMTVLMDDLRTVKEVSRYSKRGDSSNQPGQHQPRKLIAKRMYTP